MALGGLYHVIDPEIGLNVVDLGLIYQLQFEENPDKVHCIMTLTTEFCPMGESIVGGVKDSLEAAFPNHGIEVELTFEPAWGHERISEDGRQFLNL